MATLRPTILLTAIRRTSLFATGPRASAVPRLIHTGMPPEMPPTWVEIPPTQEEIRKWAKEVVESEQFKSEEFKVRINEAVVKVLAERAEEAKKKKAVGNME